MCIRIYSVSANQNNKLNGREYSKLKCKLLDVGNDVQQRQVA